MNSPTIGVLSYSMGVKIIGLSHHDVQEYNYKVRILLEIRFFFFWFK